MPNVQKKQHQRTKGNVRPSSSGQAASLLHSSGSSLSTGFIGFGTFSHPVFVAAGESLEDENSSVDPVIRMTLRKLSKKDPTTKIKNTGRESSRKHGRRICRGRISRTLQEFCGLCTDMDESDIISMLPYWPRIYNRVSMDDDHKVREASQHAMAALVVRVGRNLAPHLKAVMGHWLMAQNDTYVTVATAAKQAFAAAFLPHKQAHVLNFCHDDIENLLLDHLLNQSPITLSQSRPGSSDEVQARYCRLLISSLVAWRQLLTTNTAQRTKVGDFLESGKLAKIAKMNNSNVKAALFNFIAAVCQREVITTDVARKNVVPLVMNNIDEKDAIICPCLWEAVLSVANHIPDWPQYVGLQKSFIPKLKSVTRAGCHGNASVIAPSLLPLLGHLPVDAEGRQLDIYADILANIHLGLTDPAANRRVQSEVSALVTAYFECGQYFAKLYSNDVNFCHRLLNEQLTELVRDSLLSDSPILSKSPFYSALNTFLCSVDQSESPLQTEIDAFYTNLGEILCNAVDGASDAEIRRVSDRTCKFIRSFVSPEQSRSVKTDKVKFSLDTDISTSQPTTNEETGKACGIISAKMTLLLVTLYRHLLHGARSSEGHNAGHKNRQLRLLRDFMATYSDCSIVAAISSNLYSETRSEVTGDSSEMFIENTLLPWLAERREYPDETDCLLDLIFTLLKHCNSASCFNILDKIAHVMDSIRDVEKYLEHLATNAAIADWIRGETMTRRLVQLTATSCRLLSSAEPCDREWATLTAYLASTQDHEALLSPETVDRMMNEIQICIDDLQTSQSEDRLQLAVHFVTSIMNKFLSCIQGYLPSSGADKLLTTLFSMSLDAHLPLTDTSLVALERCWVNALASLPPDATLHAEHGFLMSCVHLLRDSLANVDTQQRYDRLMVVIEKFLSTLADHYTSASPDIIHTVVSRLWCSISTLSPPKEVHDAISLTRLITSSVFNGSSITSLDHLIFICLYDSWLLFKYFIPRREFNARSKVVGVDSEIIDGDSKPKLRDALTSGDVTETIANLKIGDESKVRQRPEESQSLERRSDLTDRSHDVENPEMTNSDGYVVHEQETHGDQLKYASRDETDFVELTLLNSDRIAEVIHGFAVIHAWYTADAERGAAVEDDVTRLSTHIVDILTSLTPHEATSLRDLILEKSMDTGYFWSLALEHLLGGKLTNTLSELEARISELFLVSRPQKLTEGRIHSLQVAAAYLNATNREQLLEDAVFNICNVSAEHLTETCQSEAAGYLGIASSLIKHGCLPADLLASIVDTFIKWRESAREIWMFNVKLQDSPEFLVHLNTQIMTYLRGIVSRVPTDLRISDAHWDFILCSAVSWAQSVEESSDWLSSSLLGQQFTIECCHLLDEIDTCVSCRFLANRDKFPDNIASEWADFFSPAAFEIFLPLFVTLAADETRHSSLPSAHLLSGITSVLHGCSRGQILAAPVQAYQDNQVVTTLPDDLNTLLHRLFPLLASRMACVQTAAFILLNKIIEEVPKYDAADRQKESDSQDYNDSRSPPQPITRILVETGASLESAVPDSDMEIKVRPAPFSREFRAAAAYLFAWRLLLAFFNASSSELRSLYAAYLSGAGLVGGLARIIRLIPDGETTPHAATLAAFRADSPSLTPAGVCSNAELIELACATYRRAVEVIPALVRQWWLGLDRRSSAYVDRFTSWYVSPALCQDQIDIVNSSPLDHLTVKSRTATREVIATYELEEVTMEMVVSLPSNYPLGQIRVSSEKRVGVKAAQWQKWLLQLNIFLQQQNGSIVEGLRLWKQNIDKRFEGLDDCMICFAVIHATTCQLPRLQCRTCHKKFHATCLYKWFNTSHNPTCPLCRNLF